MTDEEIQKQAVANDDLEVIDWYRWGEDVHGEWDAMNDDNEPDYDFQEGFNVIAGFVRNQGEDSDVAQAFEYLTRMEERAHVIAHALTQETETGGGLFRFVHERFVRDAKCSNCHDVMDNHWCADLEDTYVEDKPPSARETAIITKLRDEMEQR